MEATLIGRSGVHAVALVDKAFKKGSDSATIQHQPMVDGHAAGQVLKPGSVRLVFVQVGLHDFSFTLDFFSLTEPTDIV